jgi:two-component system, NarL family, invasion response regulator UvrY
MIRRGLSLLIQTEIGKYSITEASSCAKVMQELKKNYFSHLILDIIFGDGSAMEILPNIRSLYPGLKILIFSMQPADIHGEALKAYKITNYLSKTSDNETTVKAISDFLHNTKDNSTKPTSNNIINPFISLSSRELQILHYMLNGYGTKEISDTLNITMSSVSTLKKRIFQKTNTANFKALIDLSTMYKINY